MRRRRLRTSTTDPRRPPGHLRTTNRQDSTDAPASERREPRSAPAKRRRRRAARRTRAPPTTTRRRPLRQPSRTRARTALRARRRPPPRAPPRPLPPKHLALSFFHTTCRLSPAAARRPEPSGHDRVRAGGGARSSIAEPPKPRAHPSPDSQRTPPRRRVRWRAAASAEIGLGCCTLAREQSTGTTARRRRGAAGVKGQVAAMRVTPFVLPLAAQALVAPRLHTKRLSHQRQAAVRRPRRNPSRCLLALPTTPSTRRRTDAKRRNPPRRPSRTTARRCPRPSRPRPR